MMTKTAWMAAAATAVCVTGLSQATTATDAHALATAVRQFLVEHGDLCVAKYTWPRDVTEQDRQTGSNDAVQLPVLERLGLVKSTQIPLPAAGTPAAAHGRGKVAAPRTLTRYSLTAKGEAYYLHRKHTTIGPHDQPVEHDVDFCVARLSLDRVVQWSQPQQVHGHLETVVGYTYHISPAVWMADPEARQVFPLVDRIIRGAGRLQMKAVLRLQGDKWVPVLPGQ